MKNEIYTLDDIVNDTKYYGGEKYTTHKIFELLQELYDFYDFLVTSSCGYSKAMFCVKDMGDIDNIMFGSIKGTIVSIKSLLEIGSINDAFALVRKYEDAIITNIYIDLLLEREDRKVSAKMWGDEEFVFGEQFDNDVNKWVYEGGQLTRNINDAESKISNFDKVKELNKILSLNVKKSKDDSSKPATITLRQYCNNNVHYNALRYFLYNDKNAYNMKEQRVKLLNIMYRSISNIFVVHFSYMFVINPEYYTSSCYVDCLDCGKTPPEGSQYWVARIVQDMYDKFIKNNEELREYLKECNWLDIK